MPKSHSVENTMIASSLLRRATSRAASMRPSKSACFNMLIFYPFFFAFAFLLMRYSLGEMPSSFLNLREKG